MNEIQYDAATEERINKFVSDNLEQFIQSKYSVDKDQLLQITCILDAEGFNAALRKHLGIEES